MDGTAGVIVNDDDVVVVDAQGTPATTKRVIAEIRKLTPKPVRYVINTHWHGDHWLGNSAYLEGYPGVEIVAHANTVVDMRDQEVPSVREYQKNGLGATIDDLKARIAKAVSRDGKPYTAADSAMMMKQLAAMQ